MEENFWGLLRKRAGLSQSAFAVKMGVTVDAVRGWEGGKFGPSMTNATKAAQIGGMSPLAVEVGHTVGTAMKQVAKGSADRDDLLDKAGRYAELAIEADDEEDAEFLDKSAAKLRDMAGAIEPKSASKSDQGNASGRDYLGRILASQKAEKVETPDRDPVTGCKTSKPFARQGRTGERGIEKSGRLDEDRGRDIHGKRR